MEIYEVCNRGINHVVGYKCDTCGEDLLVKFLGVPITINFSYGHDLDGSEYHFCAYSCLLKFITDELHKQDAQHKEK